MINISKKYVYEIKEQKNYYGIMPLDAYITFCFFNHSNREDYENVLMEVSSILNFMGQCIFELFTSQTSVDPNDFCPETKDFYISSNPFPNEETPLKSLLIKCKNKMFLISEAQYATHYLKTKDISKEQMIATLCGCQEYANKFIYNVLEKCNKSKKLNVVGIDEKEQEKDVHNVHNIKETDKENKFDINNYERI